MTFGAVASPCPSTCRAADETKSWMNEKDTALLSDDYGRDLASVQALQRKHEGLERDLAALEDKVTIIWILNARVNLSWNPFLCRSKHCVMMHLSW